MGGELAFFQNELEFRPEHDRYTVVVQVLDFQKLAKLLSGTPVEL